ncbi:MAG: hypothetical protein R2728_13470 [Chitinophagales bacterium]
MPWIALVDKFQHWLYTNQITRTKKERNAKWLELHKRFSSKVVDWSDYDLQKTVAKAVAYFHGAVYYIKIWYCSVEAPWFMEKL